VVILLSAWTLIVALAITDWDAFVAASLPGTEGQGIADVIFSDVPFTGRLPYTWPCEMAQIPRGQASKDALWQFGFAVA